MSGAKSKNQLSRVKDSPVKTYPNNAVHDKNYKKTTSHYEKIINHTKIMWSAVLQRHCMKPMT
jgi:hypothetical protein